MGLSPYYEQTPNYRESIQVKLISQLKASKTYCAEFYVSLADSFRIAVNKMDIYFSDTAITNTPYNLLNLVPQITNNGFTNPLTDKTGWTKVSGNFVATGTENYIVIGNFRYDVNTDTVHIVGGSQQGSYYYIDDVSVICCDCDTDSSTLFLPNTFTPNNDGLNEKFKVQAQNIKEFKGMIYNRWGQLLYEWEDTSKGWDGKYKGNNVPEGIYIYAIKATGNDGKEYNKRGTLLIIR